MLLKSIRCTVPQEQKNAFSQAQKTWYVIAGMKGFIKQLGGWNTKKPKLAHIFSIWEDRDSYDDFMKFHHDEIFQQNKQEKMYSSNIIEFYEGNIDFLHWFIEQQHVKYQSDWDINIDSKKFARF